MTKWMAGILLAVLSAAGPAVAQVAWDAPFLLPPRASTGLGIFLIEPAGGDYGAMAMARPFRLGKWGALGIRGGLAQNEADDLSGFAGLDISGAVLRVTDEVPVDLDWVGGAGAGFGEQGVILSVPLGLSVGRTWEYEGKRFTPYLIPKVVLDVVFGDEDDLGDDFDDDADLTTGVDLGIDAQLHESWLIRFGVSLADDREGTAIGVVFNPGWD